uniref:Uncharacterized protein n=1 Tax=Ficedula albicollis TaxID=59894 RepID=A0A803W3F2_FICAL
MPARPAWCLFRGVLLQSEELAVGIWRDSKGSVSVSLESLQRGQWGVPVCPRGQTHGPVSPPGSLWGLFSSTLEFVLSSADAGGRRSPRKSWNLSRGSGSAECLR